MAQQGHLKFMHCLVVVNSALWGGNKSYCVDSILSIFPKNVSIGLRIAQSRLTSNDSNNKEKSHYIKCFFSRNALSCGRTWDNSWTWPPSRTWHSSAATCPSRVTRTSSPAGSRQKLKPLNLIMYNSSNFMALIFIN